MARRKHHVSEGSVVSLMQRSKAGVPEGRFRFIKEIHIIVTRFGMPGKISDTILKYQKEIVGTPIQEELAI